MLTIVDIRLSRGWPGFDSPSRRIFFLFVPSFSTLLNWKIACYVSYSLFKKYTFLSVTVMIGRSGKGGNSGLVNMTARAGFSIAFPGQHTLHHTHNAIAHSFFVTRYFAIGVHSVLDVFRCQDMHRSAFRYQCSSSIRLGFFERIAFTSLLRRLTPKVLPTFRPYT